MGRSTSKTINKSPPNLPESPTSPTYLPPSVQRAHHLPSLLCFTAHTPTTHIPTPSIIIFIMREGKRKRKRKRKMTKAEAIPIPANYQSPSASPILTK
jgi:hypothetical protein